jgi:hypothetical protein
MTRAIVVCAALSFALTALVACEQDHMFASCTFDQAILQACQMDSALSCTNYSCAVETHPECVDLTCLSFEGAQPRCTRACNVNEDCPGGSLCTRYAIEGQTEKKACVKTEDQEKQLFTSCAADANVCTATGTETCMPMGTLGNLCTRKCENPCGSGKACSLYNDAFFCLKSCASGVNACGTNERCIEYNTHLYCLPLCQDASDPGCAPHGESACRLPDASLACDPHQGCPGRSFCQDQAGQGGYYCLPCEYGQTLY